MRIFMKKQILFVNIAVFLPLLFGCATTQKNVIKSTQCKDANWQTVGYQEGLSGHFESQLTKHQAICKNNPPIVADWQTGYTQGLAKYCTPLRAYQLGREGISFNNVCPKNLTLDLLKSHDEGYLLYQRERLLEQMYYQNWHPFGSGRFGYPFHHLPSRHFVPNYVDLPSLDNKSY